MIFIMAPDGTISRSVPSPVYQGADGTNIIYLFAPAMVGNQATVAFRTPDDVWTERHPMTLVRELPEEFSALRYSVWQYAIPAPVARLDGVVTAQFFFYANGAILPSSGTSFTVGRGVPVILPEEPSQDVYEEILQAISAIQKSQQYGDYAARAIFSWRRERVDGAAIEYGKGEFTYIPAGEEGGPQGKTGSFVRSLADHNTQPPYTGDNLNAEYWEEIVNFDYLGEQYFTLLKGLADAANEYKKAAQKAVEDAAGQAEAAAGKAAGAVREEFGALKDAAEKAAEDARAAEEGAIAAKSDAETAREEARAASDASERSAQGARESADAAASSMQGAKAAEENASASAEDAQAAKDRSVEIKAEFEEAESAVNKRVTEIEEKIPPQASGENLLADRDFVNSSINNFAAFFITPTAAGDKAFSSRAALLAASTFYSGGKSRVPTQNDYAIVLADESQAAGVDGSYPTTRYSYQGGTYPDGSWSFQYVVNNTSLTQAQVDAINSGITESGVGQIDLNKRDIASIKTKNTEQDTAISKAQSTAEGRYAKPTDGIPESDLSDSVKKILALAKSALQSVPPNYMTTDTEQTVEAKKTFAQEVTGMLGFTVPPTALAGYSATYGGGKITLTKVIGTTLPVEIQLPHKDGTVALLSDIDSKIEEAITTVLNTPV